MSNGGPSRARARKEELFAHCRASELVGAVAKAKVFTHIYFQEGPMDRKGTKYVHKAFICQHICEACSLPVASECHKISQQH